MAKSNMKKYERQCCVCGHRYVHCNVGCSEFRNSEPWKSSFDSFNCYTLYNITAGYVNNWLPKEQEAERLKSIDLSYFDDLAEWMKQPILEMKAMWGEKSEQGEEVEKSEQVENKEVVEDNSKEITTTEVKEDIKEEVATETNTTKESSKSKDYTKDYNKNRYRNKK